MLPLTGGVVTWRRRAARVVEELFGATGREHWDDLLELRELVLTGSDWTAVLDHFLICRRRLEHDHYLPFYRLRRLLEGHLRLETKGDGESEGRVAGLVLWQHRGMADLRERAQREHAERARVGKPGAGVRVAVVEWAG